MDTLLLILTGLTAAAAVVAGLAWLRARRRGQRSEQEREELSERVIHLENQLLQARRMEAVGILAGSVVHNLNNLLAVILGNTRLAKQGLPAEHDARESLGKVVSAGTLASELLAEISDLYRQVDRARKPTELGPVVRDTLKLLRDILPGTIEIREDIAACGPVLASATGVQQVLMHLGSNAVQALRAERGVIEVSLQEREITSPVQAVPQALEPGRYTVLSVKDDGRGMDRATLERVFDAYFTGGDDGNQMGLGLATVCRIVGEHDGATVTSSRPGAGTRFDIHFPVIAWTAGQRVAAADEPQPAVRTLPSPPPRAGAALARVLLVDDDDMVAQVLTHGLRRLGYEVTVHTDARDALAEFARRPAEFDVVITDQIMPHMSGVRLTRRIHDIRQDVPVILCTGFRDSFNEQQAREAGVLDFMLKPGSHRDLAAMIEEAVPRRKSGKA
ncbi:MAG: response regulator [bacterium]|nr:response regulator [bacterium]